MEKMEGLGVEEEREEYCEEVKCTSNLGKNKLNIFSINVFSRAEVGLLFFFFSLSLKGV